MEIYIKNFRNIGEEGVSINLSPITIFTGCNSAGKSTAAKALLMLESYLADVMKNNYNLISTPLDFSKVVKLGTFDTVLNSKSKANGQEHIILGYSFASVILVADIQVRFVFEKKEIDHLRNGWLKELSISIDSKPLLSILIKDSNYSIDIKDKEKFIEFYRYYMIKQIASNWKSNLVGLQYRCEDAKLDYEVSKNELEEEFPQIKELLDLEEKLYNNGIIRQFIGNNDLDRDLSFYKKRVKPVDIVCAIENLVDLNYLDFQVYCVEKDRKKITRDELSNIIDRTYKKYLDTRKGPANDDIIKKCLNQYKESIQSYINSDWVNILDLEKSKNFSKIDSFQDLINASGSNESCKPYSAIHWIDMGSFGWTRICSFLHYLLARIFNPRFNGQIGYIDASTVDVKRLYPLDFSDRFGNLWKNYNKLFQPESSDHTDKEAGLINANPESHGSFIRKWLREFGICNNLKVENIEGMLRIKLTSEDDNNGRLLADYGYGVTQLVALLLNIEIAISKVKEKVDIDAGGKFEYGDDYVISFPYTLILEEPEVHLHPSLQSRLADMFADAEKLGVQFVIESHSEYLVRRTQVLVAGMKLDEENIEWKNPFRVYYFPNDGLPYDMRYKTNGHFIEAFGEGFFDEAGKWSRELMRSKNK